MREGESMIDAGIMEGDMLLVGELTKQNLETL